MQQYQLSSLPKVQFVSCSCDESGNQILKCDSGKINVHGIMDLSHEIVTKLGYTAHGQVTRHCNRFNQDISSPDDYSSQILSPFRCISLHAAWGIWL